MKKLRRLIIRYLLLLMLTVIVLSLLVVVPFRWLNPPLTMVMADRWLHAGDEYFRLRQTWLSWDEIPKQAALAVITSEDQRFPLHQGFDVDAIIKVLRTAGNGGQLRGASTISQQVAKNVYLWTGRSWLRKGLEVWLTMLIELTWGKQRILEVYLNIAEWGEGVFGLEAASQYHFGKPASQLTPMQSALLASCLPSPLNYDPARPAQHLRERASWNLEQQRRLGGTQWLAPLNQ
ncbi:monofunctional biosynthetic peptidoglycan transglycosylase [Methylophaga sp. OBS4]|uniref:monofunctional biosynthetic peptidoglycan transglycosylase n=1 Tax=Methylophaga sp. OBS4 TaxID=2991935 RepID=UPI00224F76B6|nr:monofunctional biosynthetic peptidoglycan transglycosylase [Methylophaga sp. OBS4]MCX4186930.1 monofunctional biosynthetic peptidoglycan transglycosylase [Methylophaga sp. OBS4]